MKNFKHIKENFIHLFKNKTSFIIIIILTILIILYIRASNNGIIEGFYQEIKDEIMKLVSSQELTSPYWHNDTINILQENEKPIYIYTNYGSSNLTGQDSYSNKGNITFELFLDNKPTNTEVKSVIYDNDDSSFNKDLNGEQIQYNNVSDFDEIGKIGSDNINVTNFLNDYGYNINIENDIINFNGTISEKRDRLQIVVNYITGGEINENVISNSTLIDYIINNSTSNNLSASIPSHNINRLIDGGKNILQIIADKDININLDTQSRYDTKLRRNLIARSKNLTKNILKLSLNIESDGNVKYGRSGYQDKNSLNNYINILSQISSTIPTTIDQARDVLTLNNNNSSNIGDIVIWLKLRSPLVPPEIGVENYETLYKLYIEFLNMYKDTETTLGFYNSEGELKPEGKMVQLILSGNSQIMRQQLDTYDSKNVFIYKIKMPIGIRLDLIPTQNKKVGASIEIPYDVISSNDVNLNKNTPNVNQANKLRTYRRYRNNNLIKILDRCSPTLIYNTSKNVWEFIIDNCNYIYGQNANTYSNLIHNVKYAKLPETINIINRELYDPRLRNLEQYKAYIDKTLSNLTKIKEKYEGLYNWFLNGEFKPKAIKFLKPKNVPITHVVVGHLAIKNDDLTDDYLKNNVKYRTIPKHCYIKVRDWEASDKIYETTSNGSVLSFYKNPITGTIIVQNGNDLPTGYVGKIVLCPDKDLKFLKLKNDNNISKRKCKKYSEMKNKNKIISDSSENLRSNMLEKKIYNQSKSILNLREYANKLNEDNIKSKIINQEYNKSKLQSHLVNQKEDITYALNKLKNGRGKYDINLNYPVEVLKDVMNIIANSDTIPIEKKISTIKKLKELEKQQTLGPDYKEKIGEIMEGCPEFDMTGYFKREPPCMGCRIPRDQTE